uniref:AP2/ERF domain-containing protein n=1 Tax=Tetradesmus obliquus TaxID=3088 RepID=A0A383VHQ4_TETOB|eukprot:jgi/Sobl393_1/2349/SZX64731.1
MATAQEAQELSAKPAGLRPLLAPLATSADKSDGAGSPMDASLQGQHSTVTAIAFSAQAQHSPSVGQLGDRSSAAPGFQKRSEEPADEHVPDPVTTTCSLATAAGAQAPAQQQALRRSSRERRRAHPAWRDEDPAPGSPLSAAAGAAAAATAAAPAASGLASSQQDFSGLLLLIETAAALSGDAEADSAAPADVTRQDSSNAAAAEPAPAGELHQEQLQPPQLQQLLPGCPEAHPTSLQDAGPYDAATSMAALAIRTLRHSEHDPAEAAALPAALPRARPRKPDRSGIAAAVAAASSDLAGGGSSFLEMLSAAALGVPGGFPASHAKQRKYTKLGEGDRSDSPAGRSRMPSSKKAAAAAAGAAGAPPAAGSNAARRSAAAAAAATGAGLQVAPADGTGSLPNLKPRGQGRWQVFLCAQGLKYLYVGQYENLPDAKHARDLAVLAVHGPKLVPTLEPVSNYSEGDIAAVRAQMAEKPAARAVMVANGLWPPEGMQGEAALHQPQQPRSRRLPGLQHTLQMIREEHKERMQQQQQQQLQLGERKGSSSSCSSQAGAASSGSCGEPPLLHAHGSKQGTGRSRAGLQAAAEAAAAAAAAGSGRAAIRASSRAPAEPADAAVPVKEEADAAAAAAEAVAEAPAAVTFESQLAELVALAAAAEAAAQPAAAAAEYEPAVTEDAAAAAAAPRPSRATTPKLSAGRMARTSSGGVSSSTPGVAASLQHYHARATANPTGTTGIREHKGVFEVFLATPPFKYLYVGRANSLYEARRMKATAMMAIYGSMLAVEQFGAEPHAVTEEDVRYMAVKLSAKPAALAAMRQYGTDALLTAAEAEAAAAAQRRAGPAAQQQLAQVQLQLQVQAQQAAAAAAAAERLECYGPAEALRRPSRRQQRQHEQQQHVSDVLAAAAERLEDAEAGLLPGSLPASNAAAMEIAAAAAKAQASIGGHRRSSRKRSAAAAFRLEQALLAAADEAEGPAASGQESDATTGGLHMAAGAAAQDESLPAAKRAASRDPSMQAAEQQQQQQQQLAAFDLHAEAVAAYAAAAAAAAAGEGDIDMADASLLALPAADPAAAAAAVAPFAEPSSSSRTSADGEACVSICTRRSMIAKDGRLGSHSTGRLGVRTHKGGYEAFIATPPFKYLYVGLYRTVQAAVQARDTAMLVVYGKEAAAALGVSADSLASITNGAIQEMAARLAKKPQAVQAMQQYGTAHLLAGMGAGAGSSGGGSSSEVALQQLAAAAVAEELGAGCMAADAAGCAAAAAEMEEQQQQQRELAALQLEIAAMQQLAAQQGAGVWLPGAVEDGAAIAY